MGMVEKEMELASEMASIAVVSSPELVVLSNDSSALGRLQDKLDDSKDRVQAVKRILEEVEDYEITPELAFNLDNLLERSIKDIGLHNETTDELEAVGGVEALGLTLTPKDYIRTRLAGCESFLTEFNRIAKEVTARIGKSFKESHILLTNNVEDLEKSLDALEKAVGVAGEFNKDLEGINLGSRLFNLFKINDKVSESWVQDVEKVSRTIIGLNNNYYVNGQNQLNSIASYFGNMSTVTKEDFNNRILMLHKAIPSKPFKDCTIIDKELSSGELSVKRSVEIMGGAYFIDQRPTKVNLDPKTVDDSLTTLSTRLSLEKTSFYKNPEMVMPKLNNEIKSLSSNQIIEIVKKTRVIIKDWRRAFENSQSYMMEDRDFLDILQGIKEADISDSDKDIVVNAFVSLIRKNQLEMLGIRASTNSYLVLIIAGLVELSNLSIKSNKS